VNVPPRVALFADCYHEVNGVANTMRRMVRFACDRRIPLLCVRAGAETRSFADGPVRVVEYQRSAVRLPVDQDLQFDLLFLRLLPALRRELAAFAPDLVHITGPGDCGALGVLLSRLLHLPLVASWHTNIHEFGARRLDQALGFLLPAWRTRAAKRAESAILDLAMLFYRIPSLILAPNRELAALLERRTGRPVHAMLRGVDTDLFHPERRRASGGPLVLGYVGRLTPEKNVRLLGEADRALRAAGVRDFRFLIVGDGGERAALAALLPEASFPGVLKGERLAEAYSSMDLMLFPSHTDTFGNVVLEAQAAGVPVLVTASGGPKYLVDEGLTGSVARDDADFVARTVALARNRAALAAMRSHARAAAESRCWNRVFSDLYESYALVAAAGGGPPEAPHPAGAKC